MILQPFFRRHFLMTSVVFIFIMSIASYLSHYLAHMEHGEFFKTQGAIILGAVERHPDKLAFIRSINENNHELGIPVEVDVVRDGKSLLSGEAKDVSDLSANATEQRMFVGDIQLPEPATFIVSFSALRPPKRSILANTFLVMFIAIMLAAGLSMFLLFWSFRDKAELARTILTRMQKGDLKARFPTSKLDEVGRMMVLFNQMADEIERLVEQLKQTEKHRLHLLQELTHDLRTPVSSLRNLIETLRFEDKKLEPLAKTELMELAYQETEYLTRLVEDLLFLALVLEPKYKVESGEVFVQELVLAQLSAAAATYPDIKSDLIHTLHGRRDKLTGSPHLMKRLFRNALENAFSHARSKVEISLSEVDDFLTIAVSDDGPGLTPEGLEAFGKKRSTRYQGPRQDGRISVGLGSVIIQAIATAHGGCVHIQNITDSAGKITGAELIIKIRTSDANVA